MTTLAPVLKVAVAVRDVVGVVGILWMLYLGLKALPELPRYIRIKTM
jgi:threonine/homoserine/homoserine lactone efflux protein